MSTIVVLKEADTLILSTDSRFMAYDYSGVASDSAQKIFEIAANTFIATSGRKIACDFQVARTRKLAVELGTTDIQTIAAALGRDSLPCLMALVERLRPQLDEVTRQAVSGESLLHGCILAGRTASGQLGYVSLSFRVQVDGAIECVTEAYFEAARKISATSGAPVHVFMEAIAPFAQDMATWIDPPEQVVARILEVMKRSAPTIGGPDQVVCLDKNGAHWISPPQQATFPLVGNLLAATITALVSMISPVISGGSLIGTQILSTLNGVTVEANGSYDSTIGGNAGLRVRSAAAPNYRVAIVPGGIWMMDASNVVRVQILGDGTVFLHDASGVNRAILDATNGQLLLIDDQGATRAQVDAFNRAGHISVNGTGASITINGRSL